jgi:hypothetical protein
VLTLDRPRVASSAAANNSLMVRAAARLYTPQQFRQPTSQSQSLIVCLLNGNYVISVMAGIPRASLIHPSDPPNPTAHSLESRLNGRKWSDRGTRLRPWIVEYPTLYHLMIFHLQQELTKEFNKLRSTSAIPYTDLERIKIRLEQHGKTVSH